MDLTKVFSENSSTSLMAIGLMVIILVMVLPVPAWILDIGLTISFALAILIFTTVLFIEKPLDFSSFPSVLLASLILRLALNVSSTKLIISEGHSGTDAAGGVIEGFAMFIMGGNLFVGLVIFGVLIIVNFMVITKGAGRMAEVGARFALDAMPGKQLAIDSDLAVGAISHEEAKQMRQREQEEAAFLGSLDGASKFVKGDAIAGLLITALNLIAGIGFGLAAHSLSFEEAANNYSVLTVGDGLVSQIPAIIVSVAAGLLLSKGRDEGAIDRAVGLQLVGNRPVLLIVSGILAIFALMPGLPFLPFMLAAAGLATFSWFIPTEKAQDVSAEEGEGDEPEVPKLIGDSIYADEIHLEVASDLVGVILQGEQGIENRVEKIRRYIAEEYGFVLPAIRMTDNAILQPNEYRLKIQGVSIESGFVRPGNVLALMEDDHMPHLQGEHVKEPVYKASARWLPGTRKQELGAAGIPTVEPIEVLATHLLEVIQANFFLIFTRPVMMDTLDALTSISDPDRSSANQRFLDEYIPGKVPSELLLAVLRTLLEERVSIRNLFLIIETVAEAKTNGMPLTQTVELVRQRLAFQIVERLKDNEGRLPLVQISSAWEQRFAEYEVKTDGGSDIALPPELFGELINGLQNKLNESAQQGIVASVATSSRRRRFVQTILASKGVRNAVLAYEEVNPKAKPQIVGVV